MNPTLKKKIGKEARRNGYKFDDLMYAVKALEHQYADRHFEAGLDRDRVTDADPELWRIAGDCIQFSKDVGAIN